MFCIFVLLLVILLFKRAPKRSAEVPSSVPEHKKAVMCLMGEDVLDELRSGVSYMLLAMRSILLKQRCMLNKVALTHIEQGYVLIG